MVGSNYIELFLKHTFSLSLGVSASVKQSIKKIRPTNQIAYGRVVPCRRVRRWPEVKNGSSRCGYFVINLFK